MYVTFKFSASNPQYLPTNRTAATSVPKNSPKPQVLQYLIDLSIFMKNFGRFLARNFSLVKFRNNNSAASPDDYHGGKGYVVRLCENI